MLTTFPTPVLSIAADAVRDLEGRDALSGLWTLFTKCKESLQDGRRLENISWRLWYCEMMRDDSRNRLCQEKVKEKKDQDHALSSPLASATTVSPHNHDHPTASPTLSSSRLGPTQVTTFRSISPADPAPCLPLDSASASLQMSKSKSNLDPVLPPMVPAHPFSLSSSSSGSKSRDFANVPLHVQINCHAGGSELSVGRIICGMIPCSASNGSEGSRGWVGMWSPSRTTTKLNSAQCMSTPVLDTPSSLQHPALTPTWVGLPNSNELISGNAGIPTAATTSSTPSSTTNSRYTSLHAAPPSPSLSESYASAHPGEVEVSDTTLLNVGVGLGPSLSISVSSPSSPQILGNTHISRLSPNLQPPPRLVVVNPTPNLTPQPTPPASPLSASGFASAASSASASTTDGNHNGSGGTNGNWLTLPPSHHPNRKQDLRQEQNHDRSRSDSVATPVTPDIRSVSSPSFSPPQPPQSPPCHQSVDEDQTSSQPFVQDLEISANSNSNRHSISSITTIASTTDSITSTTISTATAATSAFLGEASEMEESRKTVKDDNLWINDTTVIGSPMENVDVDAEPISKAGDNDAVFSEEGTGVEDVDAELGRVDLLNATTTTAAAPTKKKIGIKKKIKTKTKPLKRNSLRSPPSTLSPPPPQSTSLSSANQKQKTVVKGPPLVRHHGRSSSRSMSQSGRSSVGVGVGSNSSASRSRSGEIRRESAFRQPRQLGIMQQHNAHHRSHPAPQQLKSEKQPEHQLVREGEQVTERQLQKEEKGKGREHSNSTNSKFARTTNNSRTRLPANNTNTKDSTHEALSMDSPALAAKVKRTLADPLLPSQHKRTIVLASSESEYDSDDDGSWSSEEMGSEDDQEGQKVELQRQDQLNEQYQQQQLQRQLQQQQLQQLQQRPPHPTNHPTANHNHYHTHGANRIQRTQSSRGHRHLPSYGQGRGLMTQAAQEAQRQLDMFAKKPTESFQNLTQVARTRSVGLLTQLMNPNPEIFPVGHPYRRGYSLSEIRGAGGGNRDRDRGFKPLQPLLDVKATKIDNAQEDKSDERPLPSRPEAKHRKSSSSSIHSRATAALSPPARTLSMTKSTAAMPVSSLVQAGTHTPNAVGEGGVGVTNMKMTINANQSSGGYRPKGPPQDQELESGSEGEAGSSIQVSKSVAQEKLKALVERRGIVAQNQPTTATHDSTASTSQKTQPGDEDDVPDWAKVSQPRQPTRTRSHDQYPQSQALDPNANRRSLNAFHFSQMMASTTNHPAPIPVGHPYNLPPPAPPSTPRTTRRLMLSTELSESLRRNLLWERQVSKVNLAAAVRRTASSGGSRHSLLGAVQPLTTAAPNMVQLLPKGTMAHPNPGSPMRPEQSGGIKERRASGGGGGGGPGDENERERRRRLAMARNRSWANDYHFAGW